MSTDINWQLESEKDFMIDLSFRFSEIYQRPASCVTVILDTDASMLLGGTSEPAYHLTVSALQSEIAATKNKRSTHLIQDFMSETTGIQPRRGVLRFEVVGEENLATNGVTALQEIEQLEGQSTEDDGILRAFSRQSRRSKKSNGPATLNEKTRTRFPSLRAGIPSQLTTVCTTETNTKSSSASDPFQKRIKVRKSILRFWRK